MTIYLVTVNGKVSQEGYHLISQAHDFVASRLGIGKEMLEAIIDSHGPYFSVEKDGQEYTIQDVRVND